MYENEKLIKKRRVNLSLNAYQSAALDDIAEAEDRKPTKIWELMVLDDGWEGRSLKRRFKELSREYEIKDTSSLKMG